MQQTKPDGITPSQTVGPYFAYGLTLERQIRLERRLQQQSGDAGRLGRTHPRRGTGVRRRRRGRCRIACWRSGRRTRKGRFSDPQDKRALPNSAFKGFGRIGTDAKGGYAFDTIKPGSVPDPDGKPQAPHIVLAVYARGMLLHLYTRIYFDGEAANAADPVLALVPADRRATLIATRQKGSGNVVYRFDIHLQGDNETVFFDV